MNTIILLIIIITSLILVGIITFIIELKSIRKIQDDILQFRNNVIEFYNKNVKGKNSNKEWHYILSNYKKVFRLMLPHCYQPSTYDIVISAMNNNTRDLANNVSLLEKEVVSTIAEYEIEFKKILSQWWNIFSHFFRGICVALRIVFQYPIKLINPQFDFKSRGWNIFCAIISIIGSIASICSFFSLI